MSVSVPADPMSGRESDHLLVCESGRQARVVGDLGFAQLGDKAVVGPGAFVGEERGPVLAGFGHRLDRVVGDVRRILEPVERRVHVAPQHVAVHDRHAEQFHDHVHRQHHREFLHEVSAAALDERFEALDRGRAYERFELADRTRRERSADELALHVMVGRVHEDHHGKQGFRVERLDHRAFRGAVQQRLL